MKKLIVRSSCFLLDIELKKRFLPAASILKVKDITKQSLMYYEVNRYFFSVEHKGEEWTFKVINVVGRQNFNVSASLYGVLGNRDFSKFNVMKFENVFLEEFPNDVNSL